jgi:hypothetical protein
MFRFKVVSDEPARNIVRFGNTGTLVPQDVGEVALEEP